MTDETLYPVKVKCPHCEVHWTAHFERVSCRPEIIICETEEGGCGATFAVTAIVTITVTPTVRKIEGLGPDYPEREQLADLEADAEFHSARTPISGKEWGE